MIIMLFLRSYVKIKAGCFPYIDIAWHCCIAGRFLFLCSIYILERASFDCLTIDFAIAESMRVEAQTNHFLQCQKKEITGGSVMEPAFF